MFEDIVERTVKRLELAKKQGYLEDFALIGGLAVARWGVPRATQDIDLIVRLPQRDPKEIAKFLKAKLRIGDLRDPIMSSMTIIEKDALGPLTVQLLQFPPAWEKAAFESITWEKLRDIRLPIVGWKALVLLKLYAGGPLDLQDAASIVQLIAPKKRVLEELRKDASALRVSKRLEKILT